MEREPSKPEINEDPINAQIEAAPSDIERINIILGLVHQGETLSNEILEKGLELCVANAFFIGAGKVSLELSKRHGTATQNQVRYEELALDYLTRAIFQYRDHGYTAEAVGIARMMKEEGLIGIAKHGTIPREIMLQIL